jgi:hypothetical protein
MKMVAKMKRRIRRRVPIRRPAVLETVHGRSVS